MIKSIEVSGIGCIQKSVKVDFNYKNYVKHEELEGIMIDKPKQVWNKNSLSVILAILGKNATGKTTFISLIRTLKMIEKFDFRNELILSFERIMEKEIANKIKSKKESNPSVDFKEYDNFWKRRLMQRGNFIERTFNPDYEESELFSFEIKNNDDMLSERKWVEEITLEIVEGILHKSLKEQINLDGFIKDNSRMIIESESSINSFLFTNEDIFLKKDNEVISLWNLIKQSLSIGFPIVKNDLDEDIPLKIYFNTKELNSSIRNFTSNVTKEIDLVSLNYRSEISEGSNNMFHNDSFDISRVINNIASQTSSDFLDNLLTSIDPMISSAKIIKNIINFSNSKNYLDVKISLKGQPLPIDASSLSSGTKHFLIMLNQCLNSIKNGQLIFIDELDNGLQIRLAQLLVELFSDENINKKGAQLLFTTHSIDYLGRKILNQKNHIISHRNSKGEVEFVKYDKILSSVGINREVTRENVYKWYFNEETFKEDPVYPFMITKKERNAIIKELTSDLNNE